MRCRERRPFSKRSSPEIAFPTSSSLRSLMRLTCMYAQRHQPERPILLLDEHVHQASPTSPAFDRHPPGGVGFKGSERRLEKRRRDLPGPIEVELPPDPPHSRHEPFDQFAQRAAERKDRAPVEIVGSATAGAAFTFSHAAPHLQITCRSFPLCALRPYTVTPYDRGVL